jgi:hypothetical protein
MRFCSDATAQIDELVTAFDARLQARRNCGNMAENARFYAEPARAGDGRSQSSRNVMQRDWLCDNVV